MLKKTALTREGLRAALDMRVRELIGMDLHPSDPREWVIQQHPALLDFISGDWIEPRSWREPLHGEVCAWAEAARFPETWEIIDGYPQEPELGE